MVNLNNKYLINEQTKTIHKNKKFTHEKNAANTNKDLRDITYEFTNSLFAAIPKGSTIIF